MARLLCWLGLHKNIWAYKLRHKNDHSWVSVCERCDKQVAIAYPFDR